MSTQPNFRRKNIRLARHDYVGRRIYFLTLCFDHRLPFGANPHTAGRLIGDLKKSSRNFGFFVHAYCVMPDHVHVLAVASSEASNLIEFVHTFKQETAFDFKERTGRLLWQRKYYDRVLRNSDSPESVAWYIWLNPVRKGLCARPSDYPFLGRFTEIGQRMLKASAAPEWKPPWKSRKV